MVVSLEWKESPAVPGGREGGYLQASWEGSYSYLHFSRIYDRFIMN